MTIMAGSDADMPAIPDPDIGMDLDLEPVAESPEQEAEELPWGNDPATATWAPMMAEVNTALQHTRITLTIFALIDLRAQLALSLSSSPPHRQPRALDIFPVERNVPSVEEKQRALRQSVQLPLNNNRYRPFSNRSSQIRSRHSVSGH
jgi:hypothetical protein